MINYLGLRKNERALSQLLSWFRALKIPVEAVDPDAVGADAADLIVQNRAGCSVGVYVFGPGDVRVPPGPETPSVQAGSVTGPLPEALATFADLTEALGWGRPAPVDRGVLKPTRYNYHDDLEMVCFRHNDFRRAPDPDPQELLRYKPILLSECYNFIRHNPGKCRLHMIEADDLMTYAMVWTTNFLALYQTPAEAQDPKRGCALRLRRHIRQRFDTLRTRLDRRGLDQFPDQEAAEIAGIFFDERKHYEPPPALDPLPPRSRGVTARLLRELLEELPHDHMIRVLEAVCVRPDLPARVRKGAQSRLDRHRSQCRICSTEGKVNENVGPVDSGGPVKL